MLSCASLRRWQNAYENYPHGYHKPSPYAHDFGEVDLWYSIAEEHDPNILRHQQRWGRQRSDEHRKYRLQ